MSKEWSPEDALSPHGAPNLCGLHIGVVRSDVWSWTRILINSGEQGDMLSYLLLDLCLVNLFLVILRWLMVLDKVHISNLWRKLVYHIELSPVLSAPSACRARSSRDREHRGRYV